MGGDVGCWSGFGCDGGGMVVMMEWVCNVCREYMKMDAQTAGLYVHGIWVQFRLFLWDFTVM